jgi:hypothetical protein
LSQIVYNGRQLLALLDMLESELMLFRQPLQVSLPWILAVDDDDLTMGGCSLGPSKSGHGLLEHINDFKSIGSKHNAFSRTCADLSPGMSNDLCP